MPDRDDPAKTMRIDIHPDFLGDELEKKKRDTWIGRRDGSGGFVGDTWDQRHTTDYDKLLQSVYDAVLITDSAGKVTAFNKRATDFFLHYEDHLSSLNIIDLISGADESLFDPVRENLKERRYTLIEAYCIRSDQSLFPAEIAINKINLAHDRQLCFFVRDVSVRKRAQEALEEAIMRLEEHDKAKSQFISNVSHELRTPLTSMIYAVANMLRGVAGPITDNVKRYLEMLDGDCKRLLGTVNDILDLRKIENKSLRLAKTKIPFSKLVRRTVKSLLVQAEQKSINFIVNADDNKIFLDCDPQKIERVIINIVGNAIKFTPDEGTIEVGVQLDPENENIVIFYTRDNGIGIPPESLRKVLDRHYTVGEQASGSGLGLAISKEIVNLHDGLIDVESPPPGFDNGTMFCVRIPRAESPLVLLVDDDPLILNLLEEQMNNEGFHVLRAENGEEALAEMEGNTPSAVILDLIMPGMDGTELILKMKSDKDMSRIPVIILTAAHIDKPKSEILRNFAVPALSKPWIAEELVAALTNEFIGTAALNAKRIK